MSAPPGSGAAPLVFDPAPGCELSPTAASLLLTHGHPEHVDGALAHLRRAERAPVTVIASAPLCRYLERRTACPEDRFVRVAAGDRIESGGFSVRVFGWEHMPLLPPGLGAAARHLAALLSHPRGLARIAWGGVGGPPHGPMLGYVVRRPGAPGSVVYYGEGLHRRTAERELREVLGDEPGATLIFGAEPEDVEALPELLAGHAIGRALPFEPHRDWRAEFGMPQLDLADLVGRLRDAGVEARALSVGDALEVSPPAG